MPSRHKLTDLQTLLNKAKLESGSNMSDCSVLYRNKPKSYFDRLSNGDGTYKIMQPYIKDKSGDQKSPINGRLSGLFFSASVEVTPAGNKPRSRSAFGDTRIHVPVNSMADGTNLYFADFYCMQDSRYHYVTLVMTKPETTEDIFCESRLPRLSYKDNCFFERFTKNGANAYRVNSNDFLLVEILYAGSLDINDVIQNGGKIENDVSTFGKGKKSKEGLPKNTSCKKCNVLPTKIPPSVYKGRRRDFPDVDDDYDYQNRKYDMYMGRDELEDVNLYEGF